MGHKQRPATAKTASACGHAPVIEIRHVPNPSWTDELIEAIDKGEVHVPKHIGAAVNLSGLIGALARIKGRTKAQSEAAAHFRRSWEGGLIGGARAIDYAVPRVDTSIQGGDTALEFGAAARFDYSRAVQKLGILNARLVELVVCEGYSVRQVAEKLGYGDSRSKREALVKRLLKALDTLAGEFGILGLRHRLRHEGERPCDASADVVIERRKVASAA